MTFEKIIFKLVFYIFKKKYLSELLFNDNYFNKIGYISSLEKKIPIDSNSKPIPWFTYSFVDFLVPRINKEFRLFEYGSGNSTIFLSPFVKYIDSVEHDLKFYLFIKNSLPENVKLTLIDNEKYVNSIDTKIYDVIVIDGIYRNQCAFRILDNLSPNGVIIYDDTDRVEYEPSFLFLKNNGFKRIDFWGLSPCSLQRNCTSIFYRSNNILLI